MIETEGGAEGGFKDVDERIPHLKELPVSEGYGSGTSECPSELGRGRRMKTQSWYDNGIKKGKETLSASGCLCPSCCLLQSQVSDPTN